MSSVGAQAEKKTIRVKSWEEFKKIAIRRNAKSIIYIIARSIPASNLTSLKLILPLKDVQYIFVDSAKANKLRQTGIPIHHGFRGNRFLEDEDIKKFLKTQLPSSDLQIFSYWTI